MSDPAKDQAILTAIANNDVEALKVLAPNPGQELERLDVYRDGTPAGPVSSPQQDVADPPVGDEGAQPASPAAPVAPKVEEPNPAAPENPEAPASAAEPGPAAPAAPATPSTEEDRKRIYLNNLPTQRQLEIKIAARNADMPLDQVAKLASEELARLQGDTDPADEGQDIDAEIDAASKELEEVRGKINAQDSAWKHEDDYADLQKKRDELTDKIAAMRAEKVIAERSQQQEVESAREAFEASEQQAVEAFPDLEKPESELFAAVAGRISQLKTLAESGLAMPVVEIDGQKVTLDHRQTNFPLLVAKEQAAKLGKTATVATPVAQGAPEAVKPRIVAGVPAGSAPPVARGNPTGEQPVKTLAEKVVGAVSMADLQKTLAESVGWGAAAKPGAMTFA